MELIFYTLIPVSIFKHRNRVKSGKLRERAKWMHFVCCSLTSISVWCNGLVLSSFRTRLMQFVSVQWSFHVFHRGYVISPLLYPVKLGAFKINRKITTKSLKLELLTEGGGGLVLIYWYWHTMHIRFTKEHKKIWNEVWLLNCIKNLRHKIIEIKICGKVKKLSHLKHSRAKFVNTVFFFIKMGKVCNYLGTSMI